MPVSIVRVIPFSVCFLSQENIKRRELEAKSEKRRKQREEENRKKQERLATKGKNPRSFSPSPSPDPDGNIIDDLMKQIRGGFELQAVKRRSTKQTKRLSSGSQVQSKVSISVQSLDELPEDDDKMPMSTEPGRLSPAVSLTKISEDTQPSSSGNTLQTPSPDSPRTAKDTVTLTLPQPSSSTEDVVTNVQSESVEEISDSMKKPATQEIKVTATSPLDGDSPRYPEGPSTHVDVTSTQAQAERGAEGSVDTMSPTREKWSHEEEDDVTKKPPSGDGAVLASPTSEGSIDSSTPSLEIWKDAMKKVQGSQQGFHQGKSVQGAEKDSPGDGSVNAQSLSEVVRSLVEGRRESLTNGTETSEMVSQEAAKNTEPSSGAVSTEHETPVVFASDESVTKDKSENAPTVSKDQPVTPVQEPSPPKEQQKVAKVEVKEDVLAISNDKPENAQAVSANADASSLPREEATAKSDKETVPRNGTMTSQAMSISSVGNDDVDGGVSSPPNTLGRKLSKRGLRKRGGILGATFRFFSKGRRGKGRKSKKGADRSPEHTTSPSKDAKQTANP